MEHSKDDEVRRAINTNKKDEASASKVNDVNEISTDELNNMDEANADEVNEDDTSEIGSNKGKEGKDAGKY